MIYTGWITAKREDREELESFGAVVSGYNEDTKTFDYCEITSEVMEKLTPHWGRFFWGFKPYLGEM